MGFFNVDYCIILIYLFAMLAVGIFVGRDVVNLKDYAIANKQYGTPILMLTMMATFMGGGTTTGNTSAIYSAGIIWVIVSMAFVISACFAAKYMAPKFDERFEGMLSSGDLIKYFYGSTAEKFASIVCIVSCVLVVTIQLIALGHVFNQFMNIPIIWGVLIAGGTLIVYSSFGGIKSVTITDVIQFGILIVMVPIIASIVVNDVGGIRAAFEQAPASHFRVFDHPDFFEYLAVFLLEILPFIILFPSAVQRFLMAKSPKQISTIISTYAMLHAVIVMMMMFIAFAALVKYPDINPKAIIPKIVTDLLPVGIKGLAAVGMLAVIMSTADSFLNTASVLLVKNFGLTRIANDKTLLMLTRVSSLAIGAFAIIMALGDNSIIGIFVAMEAMLAIAVTAPMFFGIMRVKVDALSYWCNVVVASLVFFGGMYQHVPEFIIALMAPISGIITFFAVHIWRYGKIVVLKSSFAKKMPVAEPFWLRIKKVFNWRGGFSWQRLNSFSTKAVEKYGADYILFATFCCVNYILPYFMWTYDKAADYTAMLAVRFFCGFLCVGLLLKDYWPKPMRPYLPLYWHFSLMACLPFTTTAMFLMNKASYEWLINIAFSIIILTALVDWVSFVAITVIGVVLGYVYYALLFDYKLSWDVHFGQGYLAVYTLLFSMMIGFLFVRRKEIYNEERINTMRLFGGAMAHEVKNPLAAVHSSVETAFDIINKAQMQETDGKITLVMERNDYDAMCVFLDNAVRVPMKGIKMIETLLHSLKNKVDAKDWREYSVIECINSAIAAYGLDEEQRKRVDLQLDPRADFTFYGSKLFVEHVIINLIKNVFKHAGSKAQIAISIIGRTVHFYDNGCGIKEAELPLIFQRFYSGGSSTGVGLAFCKMVMEDMGGSIECNSMEGEYTDFILYFPRI